MKNLISVLGITTTLLSILLLQSGNVFAQEMNTTKILEDAQQQLSLSADQLQQQPPTGFKDRVSILQVCDIDLQAGKLSNCDIWDLGLNLPPPNK